MLEKSKLYSITRTSKPEFSSKYTGATGVFTIENCRKYAAKDKTMNGHVKRIVGEKGFGFIDYEGKDFFFHKSGCQTRFDDIMEGDEVAFETEHSPKGPRAINVRVVNG